MALPSETVKPKLAEFAAYAHSLKGDEKGEAQLFLDRFFRALGHVGIKEAGATLEFRIAKKPGSAQLELITDQPAAKTKGGKKFADLLWPDRVLIEMKKRGQHLKKHYDQLFDYWTQIVPKRPPYGMPTNADPLACLLAFNLELAAKEKDGKAITPPGLPLPENERAAFVTSDCITI